jgi:hypothetical protein
MRCHALDQVHCHVEAAESAVDRGIGGVERTLAADYQRCYRGEATRCEGGRG